jgi:hypothetical protein
MTFMQMDVDEEEQSGVIEPPDFATSYDVPEEPSMHDPDSATLLSKQVWAAAEKNLDTMTPAELEEIKHKTCAEEWRKMVEQHRAAQPTTGMAGDRQVEGMPMILSLADDGRLLQNTMRELGRKVKKTVHLQAFVCWNCSDYAETSCAGMPASTEQ